MEVKISKAIEKQIRDYIEEKLGLEVKKVEIKGSPLVVSISYDNSEIIYPLPIVMNETHKSSESPVNSRKIIYTETEIYVSLQEILKKMGEKK